MRPLLLGLVVLIACLPGVAAGNETATVIDTAAKYRREGNLRLAIELLEQARTQKGAACPARVIGELGVSYYQANRLKEAEARLQEAYAKTSDPGERALFANDLGNLSASRGLKDEAARYYKEARANAAGNVAVAVSAGLNLARLSPADAQLTQLEWLSREIPGVADKRERARYLVNLGSQARVLGPAGARLAHDSFERARALATELGDHWLLAESLDGLAQLYEDHGRPQEAMRLTDEAIGQLRSEQAQHLLIDLQWRRGRLLRREHRDDLALEAYQSAVDQIEAIRQDIPVDYVDGRSSFRATLEPIYLGLADLLLVRAAGARPAEQGQLFRRARDTVELIKQTELQDYLGDRCLVQSARPLQGSNLPAGTGVLYPVILENRLELLLETRDGVHARHLEIDARTVREKALAFSTSVREASADYLVGAKEMYDMLLAPVEPILTHQKIDTLVVVPDGVLRLVPMGALYDGKRFAITRFAIAIAPGLSVTSAAHPRKDIGRVLLAGLSEPGPVLDKLPKWAVELAPTGATTRGVRSADLKQGLALPGVTEEIEELKGKTGGYRLLNDEFTVQGFRTQVGSGGYRIIHIASHAMFSQRAEASFIMAYDDLLTIDELQTLLRGEEVQENPIELLTLSACQTAEGDDRAPLGIAGAALRARAGSALGSLWPVDDASTKTLMVRFYELLTTGERSKIKALQRAQIEMSQNPSFEHPFYWAPFILVGSWL